MDGELTAKEKLEKITSIANKAKEDLFKAVKEIESYSGAEVRIVDNRYTLTPNIYPNKYTFMVSIDMEKLHESSQKDKILPPSLKESA